MPPEVGLARARGRAAADRLETESLDFHERVRRTFLALADAEPDRYLVLDARRSPEEIAAAIRARVARPAAGPAAAAAAAGRPVTPPAARTATTLVQTGPTPQLHP